MAGRGSRFMKEGFNLPKPLIPVAGKPMFSWALRSLENINFNRLVIIGLREFETTYKITKLLREHVKGNYELILIPEVTEGQLCTVLKAKSYIDHDDGVLITSSDTWVVSSIGMDIQNIKSTCKGLISVKNMQGDQWSFARTDQFGKVVEVAEKTRISNYASTGLYFFRSGKELVALGEEMIHDNQRTRGEFYVIPVYQKFIDRGDHIGISEASQLWDMGTPQSKSKLEEHLRTLA